MARVGAVVVVLAGVAFARLYPGEGAIQTVIARPVHATPHFDTSEFARALSEVERRASRPMPGVRALVVPHHWLAGPLIVAALRDLAATREWSRVVLIGPDHPGAGHSAGTTSTWEWATPYGRASTDVGAVQRLARTGMIREEPGILTREHSVSGLVPAIRYFMPRARIVPLVLRGHPRRTDVAGIARAIVGLADDRTVVVASVDFSHYLSVPEARAHNKQSIAVMKARDTSAVLRFGNDNMDSPTTIAVVMQVAGTLGATRFVLRADADSSLFGGPPVPPVTSYVVGYYR